MASDQCCWPKCSAGIDVLYRQNPNDPQRGFCQYHLENFFAMQEQGKENDARRKIDLKPIQRKRITMETENPSAEPIVVDTKEEPSQSDSPIVEPIDNVDKPKNKKQSGTEKPENEEVVYKKSRRKQLNRLKRIH